MSAPVDESTPEYGVGGDEQNWKYHAVEFGKGLVEMSVEFGKAVRDVIKQNVIKDNSFLVRKLGPPINKFSTHFMFLNDYLPEDRHPMHSCLVVFFVMFFAFAGHFSTFMLCETLKY